jgi:hypothetical protein
MPDNCKICSDTPCQKPVCTRYYKIEDCDSCPAKLVCSEPFGGISCVAVKGKIEELVRGAN